MKINRLKSLFLSIGAACMTTLSATAAPQVKLPDGQYHAYKVVHHMTAVLEHMEEFGFNKFDHPRISDYRSFVITPALDHFYSKAVTDVRWGPVVVDTPAKDDRYSSFQVFDMEHHSVFEKLIKKEGERFVIVHENYKGKVPTGTVVKVNCNFPFIFMRTQSFSFNEDKLANTIRRAARVHGVWQMPDLPKKEDTKAVLQWVIDNSNGYKQTADMMKARAKTYSMDVHKQTFANIKVFLSSGGISGNVGGFEAVDDPAGGTMRVRAACCLMGHLGFPVHHAYYQQIPMDRKGKLLSGANGTFVMTIPYKPGVDLFWSVTRYSANNFLPLNPADLGGNDIQAYNAFNTKADKDGNVTFTMSKKDPKDGTYWMPVTDEGYYLICRYYGPAKSLNGNTAVDILYKGTPLEKKFKAVKFK
jgi:hypothetical protein